MFSIQFWMTLLKTYFLNEMVMSSKTYNMQGQPENQKNDMQKRYDTPKWLWTESFLLHNDTKYSWYLYHYSFS